jgi:hypothetical protein
MVHLKFKEKMMLVLKNACKNIFFLFLLIGAPSCIYSDNCENVAINQNTMGGNDLEDKELRIKKCTKKCKMHKNLSYYLYIEDFINSFIEIPTSNISEESSTISSRYLAGRAVLYNERGEKVGTCSASFLCMQNENGIYTDISNYLSVDNGLIVTWFTPTTLINLEVDSILHSMVTECIVVASTKVGFNPFYGKTFNMIVSSDDQRIYFKLSEI